MLTIEDDVARRTYYSRRKIARSQRRVGRAKALLVLVGTLVVTAPIMIVPAVSSASTSKNSSPLQQGMAFYKGHTITFVAPSAAGQTFDVVSRIMVPYLQGFLKAKVKVEDVPSTNEVAGQDLVAHSTPDGLTFGWLPGVTDASLSLEKIQGLNFNPSREVFLGGDSPAIKVMGVLPASPYANYSTLKSLATTSNPFTEVAQTTDASGVDAELIALSFGIPTKFVSSYSTSASTFAGFEHGDAAGYWSDLASLGALLPDRTRILFESAVPPANSPYQSELKRIPTLAKLMKKYPSSNRIRQAAWKGYLAVSALEGYLWTAPSATPAPQVAALRAAIRWTLKNKNFLTQMAAAGEPGGYLSGRSAKLQYAEILKTLPTPLRLIGLIS